MKTTAQKSAPDICRSTFAGRSPTVSPAKAGIQSPSPSPGSGLDPGLAGTLCRGDGWGSSAFSFIFRGPKDAWKALCVLFLLALEPAGAFGEDAEKATLRWKATDGDGNYGYLVYRAAERQGPYLRINAKIVRTPADGAKEHAYVFEDSAVKAGETYYYYIDTIDTTGVKRRFSGVLPKTIGATTAPPAAGG